MIVWFGVLGWNRIGNKRACSSIKLVGLSYALSTKRGFLGYLNHEGPTNKDDGLSLGT